MANFEAISESDYSTRWILQNSTISPVEDFHDDINTNYWDLQATNPIITDNGLPTDDSYVDINYPDTNYGTSSYLYINYDKIRFL